MQKNLWFEFARMNDQEKIDFISTALNTHPDQALNIFESMYKHLQKIDLLKSIIHTKSDITQKDQQELEKLKIQQYAKRKTRKASKQEQNIRLHFFQIDKMRKNNVSWTQLVLYLKKEHKIKVSPSGLRKIYNKLKNILETTS